MEDIQLTNAVQINEHEAGQEKSFFDPDTSMVVLTWVTFFLLLAILKRFAFNPILHALDQREKYIRDSLAEADKVKAELAQIAAKQNEMLGAADKKAKEILEAARSAAVETAKHIEHKAKEDAKIMLDNAKREIDDEVKKVQADLKKETVELAVKLAGKIIEEQLPAKEQEKFTNRLIKEI